MKSRDHGHFHSHDTFPFTPARAVTQWQQRVSGVSRFHERSDSTEVRAGKNKNSRRRGRLKKSRTRAAFKSTRVNVFGKVQINHESWCLGIIYNNALPSEIIDTERVSLLTEVCFFLFVFCRIGFHLVAKMFEVIWKCKLSCISCMSGLHLESRTVLHTYN